MKKEPMAGTRLPGTVVRGLKAIEQVEGIRPLDNGKKTPISGNTTLFPDFTDLISLNYRPVLFASPC